MSFIERLRQAQAVTAARNTDPWCSKLDAEMKNMHTISSAALLDLLRVKATTGNARRLAKNMRSLGFIPIKSRRLMLGGYRDTTIRGWARPWKDEQG